MNCPEAQRLLHAYLDGELDMQNSLEMERHLRVCPGCAHDYANSLALHSAIRENSLYFSPPKRLQKDLRRLTGKQTTGLSWRRLSVAAALLLVFFGIWGLTLWWSTASSSQRLLTQEVLAGHERSFMDKYLVDITSSDQQAVKSWFQGKLDFSPPVIDLTPQGFSLLGGRLDYLDGQPGMRRDVIGELIGGTYSGIKSTESKALERLRSALEAREASLACFDADEV